MLLQCLEDPPMLFLTLLRIEVVHEETGSNVLAASTASSHLSRESSHVPTGPSNTSVLPNEGET